METSYTPVQWVYREIAEEEIQKGTHGKTFFFDEKNEVSSTEGRAVSLVEIESRGIFLRFDTGEAVRIDRVITLFGKPGAAYDTYDSFGNVCFECTGGYPL